MAATLTASMSTPKFVLRTVAVTLAAMILVFFGVGYLLADSWQVATFRNIPEAMAPLAQRVGDLRSWQKWSSLEFALGNPTEVRFEGEAGKGGQRGIWTGPIGEAQIDLVRVAETAEEGAVDYVIGFRYGQDGQQAGGRFTGTIQWTRKGERETQVVWTEDGQLPSMMARWSNWFGALQEKVKQVQGASLSGLEEAVRRERRAAAKEGAPEKTGAGKAPAPAVK
ncbi:MAG: hypothetical protein AB8H80_22070 [Planctomycetota bacterium]